MDDSPPVIGAVVLAAGMSRRMGRPKLVLPWGSTTVIGQVVATLAACGVADIVVVTGAAHNLIAGALETAPVRLAFNPDYENGEMVVSLQVGMRSLSAHTNAFLLALGDQPQIQTDTVRRVMEAYQENRAGLVVPSHAMRRGHPWLVDRRYWPEIESQPPQTTLRDFLNHRQAEIHYVAVATPSILLDLDTTEDYQRYAPGS